LANGGERALRRAVRGRVVLRYVGELCLVVGASALVPVLGALLLGEPRFALPYAAGGAVLFGFGLAARRWPEPRELQRSETLVLTTAVFVLSPLAIAVPFALHGAGWLDALFEAVSGFTTTGMSTLGSVEGSGRTFLLARAWTQWVGGLGFVVLSLALVLEPGIATRRLGAASLAPADVAGSMRAHARRVLLVYVGLTIFGVALLAALGASGFDALVHALAAVSTGGFAPRDASLAPLGAPLQNGVLALSLLGAISVPLYAGLGRGRWRQLAGDVELRALLVFVVAVAGLLFVVSRAAGSDLSFGRLAQVAVSAQSTSGFATFDAGELPGAAKAIVVLSMLVGGCEGSTAGGIKLLRVLVAVRLVQWLIAETRLPSRAVAGPTFAGYRLAPEAGLRIAAVSLLFVAVVVASWLPFLAYGYDALDALFEVASATGTVGLSVGIARPELEPVLKSVLCVDMLLGRLEILAVLVAVSPRTWIGRRPS